MKLFYTLLPVFCLMACSASSEEQVDAGIATDAMTSDGSLSDGTDGTRGTDGIDGTESSSGSDGPLEFIIGLNETGETGPEFFEPLQDGVKVPIELGPQGAWMVVAAVKTNAFSIDSKKAQVKASMISTDDVIYGKITLKKKAVFTGNDGYLYMMNIWLIVSSKKDPETDMLVWEDKTAVLSVEIETADGSVKKEAVTVTMYRETQI